MASRHSNELNGIWQANTLEVAVCELRQSSAVCVCVCVAISSTIKRLIKAEFLRMLEQSSVQIRTVHW